MLTRRGLILGALAFRQGMVRLPGGRFRMGSDQEALLRQFPTAGAGLRSMLLTETPAHEVTIPPFRIDRCEVTNAQFRKFVRSRREWSRARLGGTYLSHWNGDEFPRGQADFPVVFVTWAAAMAYAKWMGKRLPTEAEWEFAARGGDADATYPWGNEKPSPKLANYAESDNKGPLRVGSLRPSKYGLFDLAGNVWEFCLDDWRSYPAQAVVQSGPEIGRMLAAKAERRVIRGGSFAGGPINMRVTARDSHRVDNPAAYVGFRCAAET